MRHYNAKLWSFTLCVVLFQSVDQLISLGGDGDNCGVDDGDDDVKPVSPKDFTMNIIYDYFEYDVDDDDEKNGEIHSQRMMMTIMTRSV